MQYWVYPTWGYLVSGPRGRVENKMYHVTRVLITDHDLLIDWADARGAARTNEIHKFQDTSTEMIDRKSVV